MHTSSYAVLRQVKHAQYMLWQSTPNIDTNIEHLLEQISYIYFLTTSFSTAYTH